MFSHDWQDLVEVHACLVGQSSRQQRTRLIEPEQRGNVDLDRAIDPFTFLIATEGRRNISDPEFQISERPSDVSGIGLQLVLLGEIDCFGQVFSRPAHLTQSGVREPSRRQGVDVKPNHRSGIHGTG
ncbi:hypothetical protein [Amycolatopsis anabasis]|uniref:hypothetical protein n=1 Tax=Amycolatopsis anabasis TaxID=1840409 RepID=UPI001FE5281F|nr:hypothetical protein [Amycolatopsis anabasis]